MRFSVKDKENPASDIYVYHTIKDNKNYYFWAFEEPVHGSRDWGTVTSVARCKNTETASYLRDLLNQEAAR